MRCLGPTLSRLPLSPCRPDLPVKGQGGSRLTVWSGGYRRRGAAIFDSFVAHITCELLCQICRQTDLFRSATNTGMTQKSARCPRLGLRDFVGFHVDFGFQIVDLWICGFQSGFLDFNWISGFEIGFLSTVYEISFVSDPSGKCKLK